MAFEIRAWLDRLAEFPGRRRLINADTGEESVVDVERDEGMVQQAGDAFSAANMNDLEQRIAEAFESRDTSVDYASTAGHAETADSAGYANSAGSVAYGNVTGRPTFSLSGSTLTIDF